MSTLILAFVVSLLAALVLTPVTRMVARRVGAVDRPDGHRKLQQSPVALGGGVAVYIAFGAALLVAALLREPGRPIPARLTFALALSAGFLAVVGLLDDVLDLRPRQKLALQFLAASPIVLAGFFPAEFVVFGYSWAAGWWAAPVTLLWLVACANAMNLLDGLDGFTSTAGITLAAGIALIAGASGNFSVAVASLALVGALVGFLPYNFPPASIYLGDTGSMLIGLVLGTLALFSSGIEGNSVPIVLPAALMAIPMWDVLMAIARRRLKRQPVGVADREHLHHQLIARGLSNWQALAILVCLCATTAVVAAVALFLRHDLAACLAILVVFAGMAAFRLFGHHERELVIEAAASGLARGALWLLLPKRVSGVVAIAGDRNSQMSDEAKRKIDDLAAAAGVQSIGIAFVKDPDVTHTIWQPNDTAGSQEPAWQIAIGLEDAASSSYAIFAKLDRTALRRPAASLAAVALLREFAQPIAERMANAEPDTIPFTSWHADRDEREDASPKIRRAA